MADIQSQLPVKLTDNTNTAAITAGSALKVDGSAVTQPISGTITATPTGTYTVTGTVATSGIAGTQTVTGAGVAGTADTGVVTIQGIASMTAVKVDGSAVTQPVSGTITTSPTGTQAVSGTVTATPTGTYTVAGTTTATPTGTYTVAGTVTSSPTGTYTVTGTTTASPTGTYTVAQGTASNLKAEITGSGSAGTPDTGVVSVQGINSATPLNVSMLSQTGIVVNYQTQASLANSSTATLSYTVTTGKTFYMKGVIASSSGAPCKVIVDYGAGPTVVAVGFYEASSPYLAMNFIQPPAISATTVVNIKILNNAGAAQDVYCTLMGEER